MRCGALFGVWLLALPALAAAVEPVISFAPEAVEASGLTPGGKVVWFGVAREIAEQSATIVRREQIVSDGDKDGAARFELGRPVPFQSIWVAVDQSAKAPTPQSWNRYSYSRNNPITRLDPDGQVDQNFTPLVFPDDPAAQAEFDLRVTKGTIAIASLLAPGPEDLLIAGVAGRFGKFLSRILGKMDEVPGKAVGNAADEVAGVSSLKHIQQHLGEFQKLDESFTINKQVDLGRRIAANEKNLVSSPGGRKVFEQVVKIGGKDVKVRVVINTRGGLRSVFIPRG